MPTAKTAPRAREIVIISGKGGTGKTSVCASFAHLAENAVICDLDVDAPDMHILLHPRHREEHPFISGHHAQIRQDDCLACGRCHGLCAFEAVIARDGTFAIDPLRCEGCGVCVKLCPAQAIDYPESLCGDWYISDTRFGPMVHALLTPGQENSGRLVTLLKNEARNLARETGADLILCDGSPGVGCPVISSLSGADRAVGVVEPTPSGRHDFLRIEELCRHFRVPLAVIINKADLNEEESRRIAEHCEREGHTLLGRIPFDAGIPGAMIRGHAASEEDTPLAARLRELWQALQALPDRQARKAAGLGLAPMPGQTGHTPVKP